MATMLDDRTFSWDHLPVGSTAAPGDGQATGTWLRASPDTSEVIPSRARPGRRACRMVHRPGSAPYGVGYRLQANAPRWGERAGTEAWYATCFLLVPPFEPLATWLILTQLHHAANTGSPPLALRADRFWSDTNPGRVMLVGRDTPRGKDLPSTLMPTVPVGQPVRVILRVVWGSPGVVEAWVHTGPPGGAPPASLDAWTRASPAGGWRGTTIFPGDTKSYWTVGAYTGSQSQAVTVEHDGVVRRQSAAACLEWLAATTTTPPPPPPPSVPTDAVRDLEAVAAQLAETARDMQAAGLMVGTVIERLRAGGGSGA